MRPIERAARAAAEEQRRQGIAGEDDPALIVRAVLLSFREPSEAMREAAVADLDFPWWFQEAVAGGGVDQTSCAWSRMIDKALEER